MNLGTGIITKRIWGFLRFQLKSKSSEGKVNIAAIRTAEESYLAEFGTYVAGTASPAAAPTTAKALCTNRLRCCSCVVSKIMCGVPKQIACQNGTKI